MSAEERGPDNILDQMGMHRDKWDEPARRMASIMREGSASEWFASMGSQWAGLSEQAIKGNAANWIASFYRGDMPTEINWGAFDQALHRGLDPVSIFQIMRGISHATWDVDAHHFGLFSFVVGAQTLQATGYAMGVTLDGADAWLARQSDAAVAVNGPDLSLHSAEALYDDVASRGPLAQQLDKAEVAGAVWRRAEVLLGIADNDRRKLLEQPDEEMLGTSTARARVPPASTIALSAPASAQTPCG